MTAPHDPSFEIVLRIPPTRVDAVDAQVAGRNRPDAEFVESVWRRTRLTRVRGGVVRLVCERRPDAAVLRLSLERGAPAAVVALARRWVARHGLWFDGGAAADPGTLVRAPRAELDATMSVDAATREMVRVCLVQVIGNAGTAAAGTAIDGGHECVHQVRVGIRKLRTVLRELGPAAPGIDPSFGPRLAEVFANLGTVRDREVVVARWADELHAADAPPVVFPAAEGVDPIDLLRSAAFTGLLLDLLDVAHGASIEPAADDTDLMTAVVSRLDHLHHAVASHAARFAELDADERHRLRRQLKRLRYLTELAAPLFKRKRVRTYLDALTPAQEALGMLNDVTVAAAAYRQVLDGQPEAWFALGWLAARGADAAERCTDALAPVVDAKRAWRGAVKHPPRQHH